MRSVSVLCAADAARLTLRAHSGRNGKDALVRAGHACRRDHKGGAWCHILGAAILDSPPQTACGERGAVACI